MCFTEWRRPDLLWDLGSVIPQWTGPRIRCLHQETPNCHLLIRQVCQNLELWNLVKENFSRFTIKQSRFLQVFYETVYNMLSNLNLAIWSYTENFQKRLWVLLFTHLDYTSWLDSATNSAWWTYW